MLPVFRWDLSINDVNSQEKLHKVSIWPENAAAKKLLAAKITVEHIAPSYLTYQEALAPALSKIPKFNDLAVLAPRCSDNKGFVLGRDDLLIETRVADDQMLTRHEPAAGGTVTHCLVKHDDYEILVSFRADGKVMVNPSPFLFETIPEWPNLTFIRYAYSYVRPTKIDFGSEFWSDRILHKDFEQLFWSSVNPELEDPFLREGDLENDPIAFLSGNEEQLCDDTKLIVRAFERAHGRPHDPDLKVAYRSEIEGEPGGLRINFNEAAKSLPEEVQKALRIIGQENSFTGSSFEYNDGDRSRRSGFSEYAEMIEVEVNTEIKTGHELVAEERNILARTVAWLEDRDFTPAEIDAIIPPESRKHAA